MSPACHGVFQETVLSFCSRWRATSKRRFLFSSVKLLGSQRAYTLAISEFFLNDVVYFPMQQINLESGLAGFPKSGPPLVPRSHPSCTCSADRSDHHHGCSVDQHRNIRTTSWHVALSLFHYHTPPLIRDAFQWAKYVSCCFSCYKYECSSSFSSVACNDGCSYSSFCFGEFFYFGYCDSF